MKTTKSSGFTLIELLVVMAIIGILAAILIPLAPKLIGQAKKNKARGDVNSIATAVAGFYADYSRLPGDDHSTGTSNSSIINELTGTGTGAASINSRGTVFLETETAVSGSSTDFLDPWGLAYRIYLDIGKSPDTKAYDGKIQYDTGSGGVKTYLTRCIAVSAGADGTFQTSDDVYNVKQF